MTARTTTTNESMRMSSRLLVAVASFLLAAGSAGGFSAKAPVKADRGIGETKTRGSSFRPWPEPVVISNGDYREEAYLEEHVGGPLYEVQNEMPRFPVPSLDDTVERLKPTALPLAESDEEADAFLEACKSFPAQAAELQRLLEQRKDDNSDSSWLQLWWQKYGYLTYRDPVAVYVSYFLIVADDAKLKGDGIARAAAALYAVADARKQICGGTMGYESVGTQPLCGTGFKYQFHACRVPQPEEDKYAMYDPALHGHCLVASKGQFYAVDFVDDNDDPLPLAVLEARLRRCLELSEVHEQESYPELGWLTSSDRDMWARARQDLLDSGGEEMKSALEKLESAAFVLNLDDDEPADLSEACSVFWHGGDVSGRNRWFDKSMQILCSKNGKLAYLGEHSMLDAAPAIPVIRRILKSTYTRLAKKQTDEEKNVRQDEINKGVVNVFESCWSDSSLLETANKLSAEGKEQHHKLTHSFELKTVYFTGYGKKLVKQADFSGPEYAQMAIQLAAYRLFGGKLVGTYEAALARYFLHGRTETARPVSPDTLAFCEIMGDDKASKGDKLGKLKEAASTFEQYQSNASNGMGIDRHLFGLSCLVSEGGDDVGTAPDLFADPLYQRSKTFRLSTSSVIFCPGFGPVVDDGIGVGFQIEKDSFIYICTSRKENEYIPRFTQLLEEALVEMGDLMKEE